MKKVLIAGGGLAGLTSAVYLSDFMEVTLIESSPKLGGRAFSFYDSDFDCELDNGQHLLLKCYDYSFRLFEKIGNINNLDIQERLNIRIIKDINNSASLSTSNHPYPFNLLSSINNYELLSKSDKLQTIKLLVKIKFYEDIELNNETVYAWLLREGLSENCIKCFWEILSVGMLNCSITDASALLFRNVLKKVFSDKKSFNFVLPKTSLSNSIIEPLKLYLLNKNVSIILDERLTGFKSLNKKIISASTNKRTVNSFDYYLSAIPFYKADSFNELNIPKKLFIPKSIVSIFIKTDLKLPEKQYAFVDSILQWIFPKDGYLAITISNSDNLLKLTNEQIEGLIKSEISEKLNISGSKLGKTKIIKEKRATFQPGVNVLTKRPENTTEFDNLFIAGDYTNTGYPSTIESAIKSATLASELIISQLN